MDISGIGTSGEDVRQALILISQRRRVSQEILKANLGSSARASNVLSILEMKGFINKPEGSDCWEIDFDLVNAFLEGDSSIFPQTYTSIEPKTIKNIGLEKILDIFDFSNPNFNLSTILTTDLSLEEIESNLVIIQSKCKHLNEFKRICQQTADKAYQLEEDIKNLENQKQNLENQIQQTGGTSLVVIISYLFASIGLGILIFNNLHFTNQIPLVTYVSFIFIFGVFLITKMSKSENEEKTSQQIEKGSLEKRLQETISDKKQLEQEINNLIKESGLRNSKLTSYYIHSYEMKLRELEEILQKMKIILTDNKETKSGQLILLEKLLYFVNKKYTDEEMLREQQKATDYAKEQLVETQSQAQALQEVKEEIRKQTEFQAYVETMKDIRRRGW